MVTTLYLTELAAWKGGGIIQEINVLECVCVCVWVCVCLLVTHPLMCCLSLSHHTEKVHFQHSAKFISHLISQKSNYSLQVGCLWRPPSVMSVISLVMDV